MLSRIPAHLITDRILPFLHRNEMMQLCHSIPFLFRDSGCWKSLVYGSCAFYALPKQHDRKYKKFLRERRRIRDNWLNWTPSRTENTKSPTAGNFLQFLRMKTDSERIVVYHHYTTGSFMQVYDINCRILGGMNGKHDDNTGKCFDTAHGKVITTEDDFTMQLFSTLSLEKIASPKYRSKQVIFQDDSSFVFYMNNEIRKVDIEMAEVENKSSLITSKIVENQIILGLSFFKPTVKHQIVGRHRNDIFVCDTRQDQSCRIFPTENILFWKILSAGENQVVYHSEHTISAMDLRNGKSRVIKSFKTSKGIQQMLWTPDSFYVIFNQAGIFQYNCGTEEFVRDIECKFNHSNVFAVTETHLVKNSEDDDYRSCLSSICFI